MELSVAGKILELRSVIGTNVLVATRNVILAEMGKVYVSSSHSSYPPPGNSLTTLSIFLSRITLTLFALESSAISPSSISSLQLS